MKAGGTGPSLEELRERINRRVRDHACYFCGGAGTEERPLEILGTKTVQVQGGARRTRRIYSHPDCLEEADRG